MLEICVLRESLCSPSIATNLYLALQCFSLSYSQLRRVQCWSLVTGLRVMLVRQWPRWLSDAVRKINAPRIESIECMKCPCAILTSECALMSQVWLRPNKKVYKRIQNRNLIILDIRFTTMIDDYHDWGKRRTWLCGGIGDQRKNFISAQPFLPCQVSVRPFSKPPRERLEFAKCTMHVVFKLGVE